MARVKHDIYNPTPAPRVIYDANHAPVTILPGQTQPGVELEDKVAAEHKKRKNDLQLNAPSGRTKAFIKDIPPAPAADESEENDEDDNDGGEGDGDSETVSETKKEANALIDQADELDFNEWKMKAKKLLSVDWPGGKPRKKDLLKLLKKVK